MLVETAHRPGWVRATWAFGRTLPEVIEPVLEGFRDEGLSLQYGGYLDLFQRVWGGVVGSELGWVELVIGQEPGEGGTPDDAGETCELSVVRLEGEAVEGLSLDTGSPA